LRVAAIAVIAVVGGTICLALRWKADTILVSENKACITSLNEYYSRTNSYRRAAVPTFEQVRQTESAQRKHTVGLAFSGGGIRSATFNLGILQGLAKAKLLGSIDYLSTVSGGGYIGAWLVSWIKRAPGGLKAVEDQLGDFENRPRQPGDTAVEPQEVNFLRDYSNYLTPRKGIFGADTWAAIATYLRNVLLNQAILLGLLGAILILPWCVVTTGRWLETSGSLPSCAGLAAALAAGALLLLAVLWASGQTAACSLTNTEAPWSAAQKYVIYFVALPILLSAFLTVIAFWLWSDPKAQYSPAGHSLIFWPLVGALLYGLAHALGVCVRAAVNKNSKQPDARLTTHQWIFIPLTAFGAGIAGGFLLELVESWIAYWKTCDGGNYHAVTWGPPLMLMAFLLTGTLHIGFLKLLIANEEQEWWARLGGLLLLVAIGWIAVFGLAIYVPWLRAIWFGWIKTKITLLLGWAGTTISGVLLGKSDKTSGTNGGNSPLEVLAVVTPYVFVLGLMVLLSLGVYWLGGQRVNNAGAAANSSAPPPPSAIANNISISVTIKDADETSAKGTTAAGGSAASLAESLVLNGNLPPAGSRVRAQKSREYWRGVTRFPAGRLWICALILGLGALGLAYRVEINVFSMNLLYRNRLVRCYLGASRVDGKRHANPFTGFDPADDLSLVELQSDTGYDGPYPIVCAALNVTHGERLAWQERKAESFVFTPHFCGYEFPEMNVVASSAPKGGYQKTEDYAYPLDKQDPNHSKTGGLHLGSAISISGAAASPNMGYHTSPPLAFLMTVFNVRLGWWLPNSRYANDQFRVQPKGGPHCSLFYLLCELLASTTDRSKYVYLSDGGHFENLAIYELVRRRCNFIIACDASADGATNFDDFGNAIRKCRSDFGVEIKIDTAKLIPTGDPKFANVQWAHGKIRYPKGPNGEEGFFGDLLYIKPAITTELPRDVLAYRDTHAGFPHQSTAEQWFDESQFESYRTLGLYSLESVAHLSNFEPTPEEPLTIPQLFAGLG
jgi:hypothetical protein